MPTKPTGRPRGRPRGSKNKPKTIQEFVLGQVANPIQPPPRRLKMAARGPWAGMTPDERKAYSQKLIAARQGKISKTAVPGRRRGLSQKQWDEVMATASLDSHRIIKKMADAGQLPDDPRAVEALEKVVITLRASDRPKDIVALGRLILDFTKPKPAQKIDHTVRTAEDYLDDMVADDDAG